MAYKIKSKKIRLIEGSFKVKPIKPIQSSGNIEKQKFAFEVKDIKGYKYKGLYELEGVDINKGFLFKKIN